MVDCSPIAFVNIISGIICVTGVIYDWTIGFQKQPFINNSAEGAQMVLEMPDPRGSVRPTETLSASGD